MSKTSWEERRLIWLARSVVHAERAIQSGEKIQRPSFSESVIGARRMRAGWEYYNAKIQKRLVLWWINRKQHFAELESIEATPYDVAAKPEKPSLFGYHRCDYLMDLGSSMDVGFGDMERNFGQCSPIPSKLSNNVANEETRCIRIYPQYAKNRQCNDYLSNLVDFCISCGDGNFSSD